jgi:hypothetical protein
MSGDNTCRIQKVMFDFDVITEFGNVTITKRTPVLFVQLNETIYTTPMKPTTVDETQNAILIAYAALTMMLRFHESSHFAPWY